jgi:hypothetical protein
MRWIATAAALAGLIVSASAETKQRSSLRGPDRAPAAIGKSYSAEESAAMGRAAQRRDEARQRGWDRNMKVIGRSICTGC